MVIEDLKIAIEVDGISHHVGGGGSGTENYTLNKKTLIKRAYLEKMGYKCANLNVIKFRKAQTMGNDVELIRRFLTEIFPAEKHA